MDGAEAAAKAAKAAEDAAKAADKAAKAAKETAEKAAEAAEKAAKEAKEAAEKGVKTTESPRPLPDDNTASTPTSNPRSRLPRTKGKWTDGTPGNGSWQSDIPEVNAITGGKPVTFINGRPVFTPWSKGQIAFKPGELNGTDDVFKAVYKYIAEKKGLPSENAAKNYLKEAGLTPHHLDDKTIHTLPK